MPGRFAGSLPGHRTPLGPPGMKSAASLDHVLRLQRCIPQYVTDPGSVGVEPGPRRPDETAG